MSAVTPDLDPLLLRGSSLAPAEFEPGQDTKTLLTQFARVLVIGAGGLGCEILKDLALSGFSDIHVIDLDRIDITNLNRQFLFRQKDVGQYKAEVAARFIQERVPNCKVTPHTSPIQDFDQTFYSEFHIIIAGLDNIEARRWLNSMVHSLVEFDNDGNALPETVKPLIDGGTEAFRGQARLILPYKTACFECSLATLPKQQIFQMCTIAETPRIPEHCIMYVHLMEWEKERQGQALDKDNPEHMTWIYERAKERAEAFGIQGVTYMMTIGVVKNVIPAIASTNALISAACVTEALKVATYISKPIEDYLMYMGQAGIHTHTFAFEKDEDCLICSNRPHIVKVTSDQTLEQFLEGLKGEDSKFKLVNPAVSSTCGILYVPKPPQLEQLHRTKLEKTFQQLAQQGQYQLGHELIVTDTTIPSSLRIQIIIEE